MSNDRYHQYAVDCIRLAENEPSPEAKTVILNMALCWLRLAKQKEIVASTLAADGDPPAPGGRMLELVGPVAARH